MIKSLSVSSYFVHEHPASIKPTNEQPASIKPTGKEQPTSINPTNEQPARNQIKLRAL